MSNLIRRITTGLKNVHEQEEGMEALQTVLIIALGAIILAFAYKMFGGDATVKSDSDSGAGNTVVGWVGATLKNLFGAK